MMIRRIDTLSYNSRFYSLSPLWKCGFAALMFLLSYFAHPIVQILIALWMLYWTIKHAQTPLRYYLILFGISSLFLISSLPALLLEIGRTGSLREAAISYEIVAGTDYTLYVTQAGLYQAATLATRIAACVTCLFFVIFTTPVPQLLQVMQRLRIPSLVIEITLIMYRFVFLLEETAAEMMVAQRARGGYVSFSGKLRDVAMLTVRLFIKTMHRYRGLSHGLIARGFTDDLGLAPDRAQPLPKRFLLEGLLGAMLLISLELWLRWRGMR